MNDEIIGNPRRNLVIKTAGTIRVLVGDRYYDLNYRSSNQNNTTEAQDEPSTPEVPDTPAEANIGGLETSVIPAYSGGIQYIELLEDYTISVDLFTDYSFYKSSDLDVKIIFPDANADGTIINIYLCNKIDVEIDNNIESLDNGYYSYRSIPVSNDSYK